MNAYDSQTVGDARIAQQLVDLMECIELQTNATWEVLKLHELVNSMRGLGNSISTELMMKIVGECYDDYSHIPKYPEVAYINRVLKVIELVEEYTNKLIGA